MSNKIIVINAGSSSIKFKIYEEETHNVIANGLCERIFIDGHFTMTFGDKKVDLDVAMPNHTNATECVLEQLKANKIITNLNEIIGIGHRVVLSGENIKESLETTD
jgi:acetate kinase